MSSAWMDEAGEMQWATYAPRLDNAYHFDADWKLTDTALGFIKKLIRERQELISKDEYRKDLILMWCREQAVRIGNMRIALLVLKQKQERAVARLYKRASSNLTIEMPE